MRAQLLLIALISTQAIILNVKPPKKEEKAEEENKKVCKEYKDDNEIFTVCNVGGKNGTMPGDDTITPPWAKEKANKTEEGKDKKKEKKKTMEEKKEEAKKKAEKTETVEDDVTGEQKGEKKNSKVIDAEVKKTPQPKVAAKNDEEKE